MNPVDKKIKEYQHEHRWVYRWRKVKWNFFKFRVKCEWIWFCIMIKLFPNKHHK